MICNNCGYPNSNGYVGLCRNCRQPLAETPKSVAQKKEKAEIKPAKSAPKSTGKAGTKKTAKK